MNALPTEILIQIFETLPSDDLARVKRACKLFNEVGQKAKLNIRLFIDAPNYPTWKLTRLILANPAFGKRIIKISVHYRRRNPDRKKSLTKYWTWNPEEQTQIKDICNTWGLTSATEAAILGGVNSESLLPFLFCLTPNVEILKVDSNDGFDEFFSARGDKVDRRTVRALNTCLREHERWHPPNIRKFKRFCGRRGRGSMPTESTLKNSFLDEINFIFRYLTSKHVAQYNRYGDPGSWFDENLPNLSCKLPWFAKLDNVKVFCLRHTILKGEYHGPGHFCSDNEVSNDLYHVISLSDKYSDDEAEPDTDDEPFPSVASDASDVESATDGDDNGDSNRGSEPSSKTDPKAGSDLDEMII
ncbi:hypothetical protein TWF106_010315 [Orbilia oligospora]|uniref:F-box domain-containing protein n=1 Tax=Orbilia oligospora TaxID=2813651 RepID=A0A7C8UHT1_ORBOL|nr:hypothetical protein TWF106_010315 [Orbilia oligospora]